MNNYESFRDAIYLNIHKAFPDFTYAVIDEILAQVDVVAKDFHIERQTTDLILVEDGIPQPVKEFIGSKAVEQKSKGTLQNYTLTLVNFLRYTRKNLKDITPNDIRIYFHKYQTERNILPTTMETMRHTFNSFFEWCYAEGKTDVNPMKHISTIKCDIRERCYLEPIELEMIRDACKNAREKAIIDFLFSTGCRVSEMCAIKMQDVDFEKRTVFIRKGKGGKSRTTFINAESMVSLKAYMPKRMEDSEYLFTHTKHLGNVGCSKKSIEMLIRKIVARCPQITKHVTPHVMRHTAATTALRNGMPLEQVKEFLGHSNLNTTMIYAKVNKDDIRRSHEKFMG